MSSRKSYLLQETYVQKSKIFLFPLIDIPNSRHFKPTNTYIVCENLICDAYPNGISKNDQILIVVYSKSYKEKDDELYRKLKDMKKISSEDQVPSGWETYETKVLLSNRNFLAFHENNEEYIYTFDLSGWESDYKCFINGRYSLFSKEAKTKILNFKWDVLTQVAQKRLFCYLYPDKEDNIRDFARELDVDVEDLMEVKELCNKPNLSQETYKCLLKETHESEN